MGDLTRKERETSVELSQVEAADFLAHYLAEVEGQMRERRLEVAEFYPDGDVPEAEQDSMRLLERKKALLLDLANTLHEHPDALLFGVLKRRLERAQERERSLAIEAGHSREMRERYWQAETEADLLNEVESRWMGWLRRESRREG